MTVPATASGSGGPLVFAASGIGLIVAVLSLPVVLLAGGPIGGWALGVVLWTGNWALQLLTGRLAVNLKPTAAVGMSGVSFIARAWLVAIILFVVALRISETVGLTAAGVFLVAFTCDLASRSILHALRQQAKEDTPR